MRLNRWAGRILVGAVILAAFAALMGVPTRWRARSLVENGATLVSNEQYLPAARQLARAVATAPRNARAHYYLGLAYAGLGQDAAALSHAEVAVRLAPDDPEYEAGLAALFLDAGRTPEAIAHLRRAAAIEPRSPDIHLLLADALRRAGEPAGMEHEYRIAIRLARGRALGALAHEQLKAALEGLAPR